MCSRDKGDCLYWAGCFCGVYLAVVWFAAQGPWGPAEVKVGLEMHGLNARIHVGYSVQLQLDLVRSVCSWCQNLPCKIVTILAFYNATSLTMN